MGFAQAFWRHGCRAFGLDGLLRIPLTVFQCSVETVLNKFLCFSLSVMGWKMWPSSSFCTCLCFDVLIERSALILPGGFPPSVRGGREGGACCLTRLITTSFLSSSLLSNTFQDKIHVGSQHLSCCTSLAFSNSSGYYLQPHTLVAMEKLFE